MKISAAVFVLLVVAPLVVGCNSKEKSTLCTLKSYTSTNSAGTTVTSYTYLGSLLVGETRTAGIQTTVTTYLYDSLGNIGVSSATTDGVALVTSYMYDSTNRLKRRVVEDSTPITVDYSYNTHGQLDSVISRVGSAPPNVAIYQYPDIVTRNPSMVTSVGGLLTHMKYDNKINPFRGFLSSVQPSNNITEYAGDVAATITYQYNSAGYPISAVWSNGSTEVWTYDCAEI